MKLFDRLYGKWGKTRILAIVVIALFLVVYMTFFDENNFIVRYKYQREINSLKYDIELFRQQIERDSLEIEEIKTNDKLIEDIARQKYGMKYHNEDVYIIINSKDE